MSICDTCSSWSAAGGFSATDCCGTLHNRIALPEGADCDRYLHRLCSTCANGTGDAEVISDGHCCRGNASLLTSADTGCDRQNAEGPTSPCVMCHSRVSRDPGNNFERSLLCIDLNVPHADFPRSESDGCESFLHRMCADCGRGTERSPVITAVCYHAAHAP